MADTAAAPTKPQRRTSPVKNAYLILYNFVSAIAWATVLGRTITLFALRGSRFVHLGVGDWTRWTQTLAAMEILHALLGVVRAPVFTTVMQVLSRFVLVWGVVYPFPFLARSNWYTSMLLAWSITEVIRYSYFALNLSGIQPKALTWLRYNTFFVLYPIGITSECALIYYSSGPLKEWGAIFPWVAYGILAVYVPGSYILYTYMMKQRKKVMRNAKAQETAVSKTQ
ncbi:putative very-long-chain (3R)-3-hydroxyacyl-CoA dehydratase 2 [Colletotrichum chlorophyti]|uniref:Very-long-chain (3R)-3-hydroxyacyl-CoA dehydratase n=1 Tax=Colletotrichum chlorophyti TaxID=708187 RepID=A0A1Q8RH71_9PEZI|nr:putative very-long-chain (3R)-3-hydroxyacyl-CoA dehydratase 2 [Colletotrichum chlorophyti]